MVSRRTSLVLILAVLPAVAQAQATSAVAPAGSIVHANLAYVPNGHERQVLDLYLPGTSLRPLPLIVLIHGGAWRGGDKAENRNIAWVASLLLEAGYAVASINHRYSQQAIFPAQAHDAKAAVRWLRANRDMYGLDTDRVGAWGASSGGHLAAMLGTSAGVVTMDGELGEVGESTRVLAVVDWYPPTDLLDMDSQALPGGTFHDEPDSPESSLVGGPLQEMSAAARAASPRTYVTPDDAPFLFFHGDNDEVVPFQQSEVLHAALTEAGVEADLHILPGAGHGTAHFRTPEVGRLMVEFFDQHLRGN